MRQDLALFDGGVYVLQKAGKGYRLFCLFSKGGVNYWADMGRAIRCISAARLSSASFSTWRSTAKKRRRPWPGRSPPGMRKFRRSSCRRPAQLLGLHGRDFHAGPGVHYGAGPFQRLLSARGRIRDGEACTPGATLVVREFGRRQVTRLLPLPRGGIPGDLSFSPALSSGSTSAANGRISFGKKIRYATKISAVTLDGRRFSELALADCLM